MQTLLQWVHYVDGLLALVSDFFSKAALAYLHLKCFDLWSNSQKTTLPLLFFKVFVGTSSAKSFSFPMILRRGNSTLSATNARETIS